MNELTTPTACHKNLRWQLLATVSAVAFAVGATGALARGNDEDRPTVWIELGAQAERIDAAEQRFMPAFTANLGAFTSPAEFQELSHYSIGEEARIIFQPAHSDWQLSLSGRYGRSSASKKVHEQLEPQTDQFTAGTIVLHGHATRADFSDTVAKSAESNTILDFRVGKDVGLGLADGANSVLSFGVRFAQFSSRKSVDLGARPDYVFNYLQTKYYHSYAGHSQMARSFRGVGPSLSLEGSAAFLGNTEDGELLFNYGADVALLFGRQKARGYQQTVNTYHCRLTVFGHCDPEAFPTYDHGGLSPFHRAQQSAAPDRSKFATVPNIGASLGVTYRVESFKVVLGYRADLFLGAMDGGLAQRQDSNVFLHGPFATISIGLGE
jgi:hypothetical protein